MKPKPYRQGELDGLCGVYSLINATRLAHGRMSWEASADLFQSCIGYLETRGRLPEMIRWGISINQMVAVLRDVIQPVVPICYVRPFRKARNTPIDEYWTACQGFLNEEGRRAVVLVYYLWTGGHWSVGMEMSSSRMTLFDSSSRKILVRKHCTTSEDSLTHHVYFYPAQTIFISPK